MESSQAARSGFFMEVPLKHKNKIAILFAMGPTLTEEEIAFVRANRTEDHVIFGCNDSYKYIDYLDEHYACDNKWWKHHGLEVVRTRPDNPSWTQCAQSAEKYGLNHINGEGSSGLSINKNLIHYGSNSGFQQLNLAFLMGCKKFYLVGYTMGVLDNKSHYFGDHPGHLQRRSPYNKFVDSFSKIQKQIKPLIRLSTERSALKGIFGYTPVTEIFND